MNPGNLTLSPDKRPSSAHSSARFFTLRDQVLCPSSFQTIKCPLGRSLIYPHPGNIFPFVEKATNPLLSRLFFFHAWWQFQRVFSRGPKPGPATAIESPFSPPSPTPLRAGASLPQRLSPNQLGPTFPPRLRGGALRETDGGRSVPSPARSPQSSAPGAGRSGLARKTPAALRCPPRGPSPPRTPRSQLPPSPPLGQLSKAPSPPLHVPPTTLPTPRNTPAGKPSSGLPGYVGGRGSLYFTHS